jgi:FixJ family two-component response regulator
MVNALPWIAIVDDDPSVLKALSWVLRARGFQTRTYTSARDFTVALPDGLPECLILDLQMPAMDGIELQHYLARQGIRIPTIVITADNEGRMRKVCESLGAVAFLLKPFEDTALLVAVEEARNCNRGRAKA